MSRKASIVEQQKHSAACMFIVEAFAKRSATAHYMWLSFRMSKEALKWIMIVGQTVRNKKRLLGVISSCAGYFYESAVGGNWASSVLRVVFLCQDEVYLSFLWHWMEIAFASIRSYRLFFGPAILPLTSNQELSQATSFLAKHSFSSSIPSTLALVVKNRT